MAQIVECEICLEECQKDELEVHREMCIARLIFRCAICDEDYLSKEGLWNHLDLHEIPYESKELHYQEMRATYKLHQCDLCNDHRGYKENLFWKHVHREHDGFFLRCSECSESFRSHKLKIDHDLTHCKAREQIVTGGLEADQEFSNIVLPITFENVASLDSCNEINENATIKKEPLQDEWSNVPGEGSKCSDINITDQQVNQAFVIDSQLCVNLSANFNNLDDMDNNITEKDFKVHPIACSKSMSELNVEAEKKPSDGSSDTKCSHCEKEFSNYVFLARHINLHHKSHSCDICGITFDTYFKARYHKIMKHRELKHKCPYCSKLFLRKKYQRMHSIKYKNKEFSCDICHQKYKDPRNVVVHMKRFHHDIGSSKKVQIDSIPCNEEKELYQADKINVKHEFTVEETSSNPEKILQPFGQHSPRSRNQQVEQITFKMEITEEESTLSQHDDFGISTLNSSTISDFSDCIQHSNDLNVENSKRPSLDFAGQKSTFTHTSSDLYIIDYDLTEKESEVLPIASSKGMTEVKMAEGKNLKPLVENPLTRTSETTCSHCGKQFSHFVDLARHIETSHQSYPCHICGIILSNNHQALYHKMTVHTEPKHKCPHCLKLFHRKGDQRIHISKCKTKKFPCEICHKNFKFPQSVISHKKEYHRDKEAPNTFQINRIRRRQKKKQNLAENITDNKDIKDEKTLSITEKILQPHVQDSSSVSSSTKCAHCGKEFVSLMSLSYHIVSCHKPTTCNICGKLFPGLDSAKYHKGKYHSDPKFSCPDCPKTFHHKGNFHKHLSKCGSKKFPCELCGKKLKNQSCVDAHKRRIHHIEEDLSNIQDDLMRCKNQQEQKQGEEITLKMEITVEETKLIHHNDFGITTPNPSTINYCPDLSQKAEVPDCSGQNSALAQTRRTDNLKGMASSNACLIDRKGCNVAHEQNQPEKITIKKEILEEETT